MRPVGKDVRGFVTLSWKLLFCLTALFSVALGDSVTTKQRTVVKLAEGVYTIRHPDAPDTFPQGNTTVVVGDNAVLVVDSCYMPSSAREDIAQIRQWTTKPVRYLVNTHWHYDHTMGNGVYAEAFPQLNIIAQVETRNQMKGYNPGWFARFPARADRFRKMLDSGKNNDGKPLTDIDKRDLATAITGVAAVQQEFKFLVDRIPDTTFQDELDVDLGSRKVQIRHLGRGNTAGDAIIYLPVEKILVAGDLLDHPVPYLGGGFPFEEVATLERMAQLDAQTIVPGHGDVLHDKRYLMRVIEFIRTVTEEVRKQVWALNGNDSRKLDEIQAVVEKNVNLAEWRQGFAGDDAENKDFFDGFTFPGLVKAAYAESWPK
jgi:cyclase